MFASKQNPRGLKADRAVNRHRPIDRSYRQHARPADQAAVAQTQTPSFAATNWSFVEIPVRNKAVTVTDRPPNPSLIQRSVASPGRTLDGDVRSDMERRFSAPLHAIRVHDDAIAARAADSVNAQAFALGQDLVFNQGAYRPREAAGRRLLAHELVHALQQGEVTPKTATPISRPSDPLEAEADQAAAAVLEERPLPQLRRTPAMVARQPKIGQPTSTAETPADKYRGTKVSKVTISIARKRVSFQTPLGSLMGRVDTDLAPGEYTLQAEPGQQRWAIHGPNVKSGLRFSVDLEEANPWTLSYSGPVPLTVTAGSKEEPATFGDMIDPKSGRLKDPLWLQEGVPITKPISGDDDFESVAYDISYQSVKGNLSKVLMVSYRDNSEKDINIDDIGPSKPRLWTAKQDALKIMDDYNLMFVMGTFPTVFFIITIQPLAAPVDASGPRYMAVRRSSPRGVRALRGGGASGPDSPSEKLVETPGESAKGGSLDGAGTKRAANKPAPEAGKVEGGSGPKAAEGDVPTSGPDLFKKTAQRPGGQAERVRYFDENLAGVRKRTSWKAEKMGTATDGSIIYRGEKQERALAIKTDGTVYTGTWQKDVIFSIKDGQPTLECDWASNGWKQW